DFFVGEDCDVLIVAGCGIHNDGNVKSEHNGIHTFHVGKNAKVKYIEKHLGIGNGAEKILNPQTNVILEKNSTLEMETVQLGGVSSSIRKTSATLFDNSHLVINEKIKTTEKQTAITDFEVKLLGKKSSAKIVSRSVASDNSYQEFNSNLIGENECFGHVECDGLLAGDARIKSIPKIDAKNVNANLVHEAQIGKIAGDQLIKLTTLGLTKAEAEKLIISAYLK
ncbi:MAG: SufD family Fe-S cluster assembly protein, partial [Clostridia bacterium]|nr:SufD family Fe-S cluster assembly protein [Clostridia bacterium]